MFRSRPITTVTGSTMWRFGVHRTEFGIYFAAATDISRAFNGDKLLRLRPAEFKTFPYPPTTTAMESRISPFGVRLMANGTSLPRRPALLLRSCLLYTSDA